MIIKRYLGSPLRYRGSKSLLVQYLKENLPNQLPKTIVSPFFGGGSFEIYCNKELGINIIGFDVFDLLVNYWQVQISNPQLLYNSLPNEISLNNFFESLKYIENKENKENLLLAKHFWINHNLSFGPDSFSKYPSKERFNPKTYNNLKLKVKNFKSNINIFCDSFENIIPQYKNYFLYLDPPYYNDEKTLNYYYYPNIHNAYYHKGFNHIKLNELLKNHEGKFMLSYNNSTYIKELYKDFTIIEVPTIYGLNTISGKSKKTTELIIKN